MARHVRHAALAILCAGGAFASCGKRGDPLPPLRKTPLPVTGLRLAQRGDRLEVAYNAPRTTTDGLRLPVLDIEVLRADADGDFSKVARRLRRKAAPGESLTDTEPLPPPGTTLRFAARAVSKGRGSVMSAMAVLTVQPQPEAPGALWARLTEKGVTLGWAPPAQMPTPPPTPPPPPSPAPTSFPNPPPTPSPSPTPRPITTGFWVYRRTKDGSYGRPIQPTPLEAPGSADSTASPGETWCYTVRTVASTDPVVESADSNEACLAVRDIAPPAPPTGVTVLAFEGALEVSWSPSPEADLEAYHVYRAVKGSPPERLQALRADQTKYRDATAMKGFSYVYTVTAVDTAGNQSPPSAPAPGRLE